MAGGVQHKGGKKNRKFNRNRGRLTKMGKTGGKCVRYREQGRREKNKARRIGREQARAKLMPCGHGSRHRSPYDDTCRRCCAVS